MAVIFKEDGHVYESLDPNLEKEDIKWTSVTSFIGMFKPKFDAKHKLKNLLKIKNLNGTVCLKKKY